MELMKRIITIVVLIALAGPLSLHAQDYNIIWDGKVCTGRPTTFTATGAADYYEWFVNGVLVPDVAGDTFTYTFPGSGSNTVSMNAVLTITSPGVDGGTETTTGGGSARKVFTVLQSPEVPLLQGATSFCDAGNLSLTISNSDAGTYIWTTDNGFYSSGSSASVSINNVTQSTNLTVEFLDLIGCSSTNTVLIEVNKTTIQPQLDLTVNGQPLLQDDPTKFYHKRTLIAPNTDTEKHYWQTSADGTDLSHPVNGNYTVTQEGTYYVRCHGNNCWANPTSPVQVAFSYSPPKASISTVKHNGYNEFFFADPDRQHILTFANYYWYLDAGATAMVSQYNDGISIMSTKFFEENTYYMRGQDIGSGTWGPVLRVDADFLSDDRMNWVSTQTFDGTITNGLENIASSTKSYFDETGKSLQSQSINMSTGQVLASDASIKDMYGRDAVQTLPAPTNRKYIKYRPWFVTDEYGDIFDHHDFEELSNYKLGSGIPGTVGWYYGPNNTLETNVAQSKYPYSRIQYYKDGISGAMFRAGLGEQLSINSGHESLSGTFPVTKELDYYLKLRGLVLPTLPTTLVSNAVQTVVRDENGRYAVSIADKSGKTVFTARKGAALNNDFVIKIDNLAAISSDPASLNFITQFDFYILDDQAVNITGNAVYNGTDQTLPSYSIKNIITDEPFVMPPAGGIWPAGFYRIVCAPGITTAPSGAIQTTHAQMQLSFSNYYQDVACQFYNDAGRLVSSLSPNGFQEIIAGTNLLADYTAADKTTYSYNHRGWLLSMTEPDAGTTQYMYRKDGSIRYSQNAKQKLVNRFSYTSYDQFNRPVESGEYKGVGFIFGSDALKATLDYQAQVSFDQADVCDWVRTHYDYAFGTDPNETAHQDFYAVTGLPTDFKQTYARNAVSWTENANNTTWYSYNELGRVVWMAQKPKAANFPLTFVVEYTYDFLGNVTQVKQRTFAGSSETNFYHHYEYDADKRLSKAYTSADGTNKVLHAAYQYYLHGPLKRIELGGKLQGIDFTYNINGWLTAINHPNQSKDPGQDGVNGSAHQDFRKDVFGLLLNYYESEFTNLFPATALNSAKDFERIHHLPKDLANESAMAGRYEKTNPDFLSGGSLQPDFFKSYSAQNSIYKELVKRLSESSTSSQTN
jgi:hypothetical protein